MTLIKVDDFLLEDTQEMKELKKLKKGIEGVKVVCRGFLKRALECYKRIKEDDPSPTLAGKAIAYIMAFKEIAIVSGIDLRLYEKTLQILVERLGAISFKIEENRRTVVIQHRRDPNGIELEKIKLEVRKDEDESRDKRHDETIKLKEAQLPSNPSNAMMDDIAGALRSLGYKPHDAERRAFAVYKDGVRLEELIMEACRLPD